jgi:hypothetical protein
MQQPPPVKVPGYVQTNLGDQIVRPPNPIAAKARGPANGEAFNNAVLKKAPLQKK